MSSQRAMRRAKQVANKNPINVTMIVDGAPKVFTWKEYQLILNPETEESD